MTIDQLRDLCLSFPGATEKITWGNDLTFRVKEKIFAVTVLELPCLVKVGQGNNGYKNVEEFLPEA